MRWLAMVVLDIDPNVVRPGWTPLIITVLLALAMVGLFLSMRHQFRKIEVNRAAFDEAPATEELDEPSTERSPGSAS